MSPSLFTHKFVLKLSLGPPVASQRAVSSSVDASESALDLCNLQSQYACLLSILFHSLFHPRPEAKLLSPTYLNHHTPYPLPTLTHPNTHISEQRWVADI